MSTAFDVSALTKALTMATEFITAQVFEESGLRPAEPISWVPENGFQSRLMQRYDVVTADLKSLPELKGWAKKTAEELNQILGEQGFSIRLEPWQDDTHHFGVVAIYDLTIEWLVTGTTVDELTGLPLVLPTSRKPAFRLPFREACLQFYRIAGRVVVKIPGKRRGDWLCLTAADRELADFEMLEMAEALSKQIATAGQIDDFIGAVLPNIVFDTGPDGIDVSWLEGLKTVDVVGDLWTVVQAKMQAKFAMGPKGARAKVAVAIGMERSFSMVVRPKVDYVADHDLLIWMEREGVRTPFFVAYVPQKDFADHMVGLNEID